VKSIASSVAAGKDEGLTALPMRELIEIDAKEHLVEEQWETDGVGGRAVAVIRQLNRE